MQVTRCECVICMGVPDAPKGVARPMKCCGAGMCESCLGEWFGRKGQRADPGYEDGVQGVSHVAPVRRGPGPRSPAVRWTRIGVRRARRLFSRGGARLCRVRIEMRFACDAQTNTQT